MRTLAALALCASITAPATADVRTPPAHAPDVQAHAAPGAMLDPLSPGDDVRVLVFVRRDCPIANRYAPELARLQASFPATGAHPVTLVLVYVDPADTPALVVAHEREYALTLPWVLDPDHRLARLAAATVTPEAAVYSPGAGGNRELLYRGRIDDRFVDVGRTRPAPSHHDLRDAITAAVEGRRPAPAGGPATGCFIDDAR